MTGSLVRQRLDARQRLPAEELERGAAAGRDVRDAIGDAGLVDGRHRIAAADDRRALDVRHRLRDAERAGANASISKTPIGPFHTTVFASRRSVRVEPRRLGSDVEAHAIADRGVVDLQHRGRARRVDSIGDDVIDGQVELDVPRLGVRDDVARGVELVVLDQRLAQSAAPAP